MVRAARRRHAIAVELLRGGPRKGQVTSAGVFACGDVRQDSVKRVASAVGEGAAVLREIHDYPAAPVDLTPERPRALESSSRV
jgi:hypothetical protein